jgi:undecaprenyl-diphosphatase
VRACVFTGLLALAAIAVSAWLATLAGAERAQTGLVRWFNDPPQPFAAVFALVNPLCRPVPLALVAAVFIGWVLITAAGRLGRLEALRALVIALALAEIVAQVLKRVANQPRPLAVIEGLDTHGYPTDPNGNAYPSAHTALLVGALLALWPWMRWPQRVVGVIITVSVALNRIYIGAHWPIDVLGGAAVGVLAGDITWLAARRWPLAAASSEKEDTPTT